MLSARLAALRGKGAALEHFSSIRVRAFASMEVGSRG